MTRTSNQLYYHNQLKQTKQQRTNRQIKFNHLKRQICFQIYKRLKSPNLFPNLIICLTIGFITWLNTLSTSEVWLSTVRVPLVWLSTVRSHPSECRQDSVNDPPWPDGKSRSAPLRCLGSEVGQKWGKHRPWSTNEENMAKWGTKVNNPI